MKTKKMLTTVYIEKDIHKKIHDLTDRSFDESFTSVLRKIISAGLTVLLKNEQKSMAKDI